MAIDGLGGDDFYCRQHSRGLTTFIAAMGDADEWRIILLGQRPGFMRLKMLHLISPSLLFRDWRGHAAHFTIPGRLFHENVYIAKNARARGVTSPPLIHAAPRVRA